MRQPRRILPCVPHHFVLRGNNRRRIFSYRWEYLMFLRLLRDAAERHEVPVHALALMSNHVHLVATPPTAASAPRFIKSVSQRYAQRRNRRRRASGKLFEQRYFSVPVLGGDQLAVVTAYVELNPVRAGRCRHPRDAEWTTYRLHAGLRGSAVGDGIWTPSPWYRALGRSDTVRRARYVEWVADCRARDRVPDRVLVIPRGDDLEVRVRRPDGSRAT